MNILFAIKTIKKSKGGAERVLLDIANGLAKEQNVSLLTFDGVDGTPVYPIDEKINLIYLELGDAGAKAGFIETVGRILLVRKYLKQHKPDIIIAFLHSMFVPMVFSCMGIGIPLIASEHIVPKHYDSRKLEYFLMVFAGLWAKKITVLSEKIKDMYPAILHSHMVAIPDPVIFPENNQIGERRHTKNVIHTILNIGRLDPQKNQACLIKAFALLADKYPDWQLRIVGEGDLRDKLQSLVHDIGLSKRTFLPGIVNEITDEYLSAEIFVISSTYESFGLATAEAMAHCLPVVGFADCSGTNELIIDNENGFLVEGPDRHIALATAVEKLIMSTELRKSMGQCGKASVSRFRLDRIIDEWDQLIQEVVEH